ncbi:MAG: transposase [Saprospiraceae bacterium]|nr:transposase [Saprospiraceae bacterium]
MSDVYTEMLEEYQIRISVCFDVLENAHCERANGTIKNEYLNRWSIKDEDELFYRFKEATENYNNRKHNSIKMTPNDYEIFLNEVPLDKREKMEIFTIKSDTPNPFQLELKFDL